MRLLPTRRITIAEYLTQRGLPADWRFGSPLGRVAAEIYRQTYHHEPSTAWQFINGRFRRVMAYLPSETHVLADAWDRYGHTAGQQPAPVTRAHHTRPVWPGSGDAMRWRPTGGPIRSHP